MEEYQEMINLLNKQLIIQKITIEEQNRHIKKQQDEILLLAKKNKSKEECSDISNTIQLQNLSFELSKEVNWLRQALDHQILKSFSQDKQLNQLQKSATLGAQPFSPASKTKAMVKKFYDQVDEFPIYKFDQSKK
ncbi:Hypothetical_protein [Hexamita inflata]|uniref:Hypothetical_protein n=1 Tax=Hexamita inflata TaxID=28002 RepID=A0AA86P675_9EUKA|nr:Hypothetical protein HINF_LOCUS16021 [Hexamita inflata]CAI9931204.1 Hypothetical protein HINF_LOCUS18849 [Hexamita inflata]